MDIKGSEEKLKDVDSFLTTLTKILKKHWIILSLITLCTLGYFFVSAVLEETEYEEVYETEQQYEDQYATPQDSVYDENGDTLVEEYTEE
jgi:cell division protein FtsI/penicillin-binding protein 2